MYTAVAMVYLQCFFSVGPRRYRPCRAHVLAVNNIWWTGVIARLVVMSNYDKTSDNNSNKLPEKTFSAYYIHSQHYIAHKIHQFIPNSLFHCFPFITSCVKYLRTFVYNK